MLYWTVCIYILVKVERGEAVELLVQATNRKVAGSIPCNIIEVSKRLNPSGRTLDLGSTQPLTEMNTRDVSWGVKTTGAYSWPYHLHVSNVFISDSLNLLEPSGPVQPCTGIAVPKVGHADLWLTPSMKTCTSYVLKYVSGRNYLESILQKILCSNCYIQRMFAGSHATSEKVGVIHLPSFLYLEQQQPISQSSFLT